MQNQLERNKKNVTAFYDLMLGKIVEHWDVLQVVPQKSANGNMMF